MIPESSSTVESTHFPKRPVISETSVRRDPLSVILLFTIVATLCYFFGFLPLFVKGTAGAGVSSAAAWAWQAWNPIANQEHSKLVPFISLGLVWYHWGQIKNAKKQGANFGLVFVGAGIALFCDSAQFLLDP